MLNFEHSQINNPERSFSDSFEFGKSSKKRGPSMYEKCALKCVNMTASLSQQEVTCIKACYSKEFNNTGFKDAKLYL